MSLLQVTCSKVDPQFFRVSFSIYPIFDKSNYKLLHEMNLGSDSKVGIATGQDSAGNQKIFALRRVGAGITFRPLTPCTMVAVGLCSSTQTEAKTTTVTTTATTRVTTVTSTQPAQTTTVTPQ
ncbi:MAG: hypothetical protein A3K61_05950 [Thaumarchaeota archaeon RBG_16_49_8]|nr:MAG: hypothetical protein A3K61_05950 [Thaumarchaeota archaeon RBG_16_49_8]